MNRTSQIFRVSSLAISTALFCISLATSVMSTRAQDLATPSPQPSISLSSPPTSSPVLIEMQKEKLELEIEKLRIENLNNERNLFTLRGWTNLLFGSGTVIVAIVLGFGGLYRYLQERREEIRNKEDERFEVIVKSLGSQYEQERVSAAGLLPTFLRPEYERFYVQVCNLAVGSLRSHLSPKESDQENQQPILVSINAPETTLSILQGK